MGSEFLVAGVNPTYFDTAPPNRSRLRGSDSHDRLEGNGVPEMPDSGHIGDKSGVSGDESDSTYRRLGISPQDSTYRRPVGDN